MNELTIRFDNAWVSEPIKEYLSSLKGVLEVYIKADKEEIYIKYDLNLTSIKILKLEMLTFMNVDIPSIIAFNKYFKTDTTKATITINDLCCEYCLKGMIEELLDMDGIESTYSDFNFNNKDNVTMYITYGNKLITKEQINNIETKFNS